VQLTAQAEGGVTLCGFSLLRGASLETMISAALREAAALLFSFLYVLWYR